MELKAQRREPVGRKKKEKKMSGDCTAHLRDCEFSRAFS